MHCKYKGCTITTRNGHRHTNWEKWQLCKKHAIELHGKELSPKFKTGRYSKEKKLQFKKKGNNK